MLLWDGNLDYFIELALCPHRLAHSSRKIAHAIGPSPPGSFHSSLGSPRGSKSGARDLEVVSEEKESLGPRPIPNMRDGDCYIGQPRRQ